MEKGCPTRTPDSFELFLDLHSFTCKLTLKRFFLIKEQQNQSGKQGGTPHANTTTEPETIGKRKYIKGKSTVYPVTYKGNYIETFHDLVQDELEKAAAHKIPY